MKEMVYLYNDKYIASSGEVDAYLIPVKGLSTRSIFELDIEVIEKLKLEKPLYLLCDALISQSELQNVREIFNRIICFADKVFFSRFSFFSIF